MTIVDILLHKWHYATPRQRQLTIGGSILALIALLALGWLLGSAGGQSNAAAASRDSIVASPDESALAAFTGALRFAAESIPLTNLTLLVENKQAPDSNNSNNLATIIRLKFDQNIELKALFVNRPAASRNETATSGGGGGGIVTEATRASVIWNSEEAGGFNSCKLDGASLFAAPKGRHYLCNKTRLYNCTASDDELSFNVTLVVDLFELQLDRTVGSSSSNSVNKQQQQQQRRPHTFESEPYLCP